MICPVNGRDEFWDPTGGSALSLRIDTRGPLGLGGLRRRHGRPELGKRGGSWEQRAGSGPGRPGPTGGRDQVEADQDSPRSVQRREHVNLCERLAFPGDPAVAERGEDAGS
jgi:hypothetical protein